ncbi:hypothetical protein J3Q64DRAFT_1617247, partial [Phycomyces blakesleeanus]
GHKSARSPSCEAYIASKQFILKYNLGQGYQAFTRKLPLDNYVHQQYINRLKPPIIFASRNTKEIVFRSKIFVNYYIKFRSQQLQNNNIPHCILTQQSRYYVCQMVSAKRVTGTLQCIAEVCTELSTSYQNNIAENFEARLVKYLYYHLQSI